MRNQDIRAVVPVGECRRRRVWPKGQPTECVRNDGHDGDHVDFAGNHWLGDPADAVADPAPHTDASHPLVAQVLDLYRAAIRDSDTPEDLAARYVAATLRGLADDLAAKSAGHNPRYQPTYVISSPRLHDLADEIDPPEATP